MKRTGGKKKKRKKQKKQQLAKNSEDSQVTSLCFGGLDKFRGTLFVKEHAGSFTPKPHDKTEPMKGYLTGAVQSRKPAQNLKLVSVVSL